jgi:hypothetical protein
MKLQDWKWDAESSFSEINSGQWSSREQPWGLEANTELNGASEVRWASDYIRERAFNHSSSPTEEASTTTSPTFSLLYGPSPKSEYSLWASFVLAEGLPSDLREEYVIKMRGEDPIERIRWERNKNKANEEEKGDASVKDKVDKEEKGDMIGKADKKEDEGAKAVREVEYVEDVEEKKLPPASVTRVDSLLSVLLRNPYGHVCFTKTPEEGPLLFDAATCIENKLYLFKFDTEQGSPIPQEDLLRRKWIADVPENTRQSFSEHRSFLGIPFGENHFAIREVVPTLVTPKKNGCWIGSFRNIPEELLRSPQDLEIRFSVCTLSPITD